MQSKIESYVVDELYAVVRGPEGEVVFRVEQELPLGSDFVWAFSGQSEGVVVGHERRPTTYHRLACRDVHEGLDAIEGKALPMP